MNPPSQNQSPHPPEVNAAKRRLREGGRGPGEGGSAKGFSPSERRTQKARRTKYLTLLWFLLTFLSSQSISQAGLLDTARSAACLAAATFQTAWHQYVAGDPSLDVTPNLKVLGNPWAEIYPAGEQIYARNPWDLQVFSGRLYLGGGNSSNKGPAQNAGPVPILALDQETGQLAREGQVDEEQIDRYRVFNNQLYIPGHDPTESWKKGNYYRDDGEQWRKFRNIPEALHTYDLAWHDGRMFAGLGTKKGAAVAVSADKGASWELQRLGRNRVYTFMAVDSTLYAVKGIPTAGQIAKARKEKNEELYGVAELRPDGSFAPRPDLSEAVLFPDGFGLEKRMKKIVRPVTVDNALLYIGAYVHNDHQFLPFGLFLARSLKENRVEVQRVCLPLQYEPWDILVHEEFVYLLVELQAGLEPQTMVRVLRAPKANLSEWEESFHFSAPTFARSFEILQDDFYFGLGSEIVQEKNWRQDELKQETGTLLRLKKAPLTSGK